MIVLGFALVLGAAAVGSRARGWRLRLAGFLGLAGAMLAILGTIGA